MMTLDETSSNNIRMSVWGLIALTCNEEENAVGNISRGLRMPPQAVITQMIRHVTYTSDL